MSCSVFISHRRSDWQWALLVMSCTGMYGCTRDTLGRAAVGGTVLVDGEPLPRGRIVFVPSRANPGPKSGGVISNGHFNIPIAHGPVVGTHRVEIYDELSTDFEIDSPNAVRQAGGELLSSPRLPARFHRQSELTATVFEDKVNEMLFELITE